MTIPPPPPQTHAPSGQRPAIVTQWTILLLVLGIILIAIAAWDFSVYAANSQAYLIVSGGFAVVIGILCLIGGLGMLAAKPWALKLGGTRGFSKRPDVRAYFGLPPEYSAYPPGYVIGAPPPMQQAISQVPPPPSATPPASSCPTCGQPLIFIAQYNRWYCQTEKKYV